MLSTPTFPNYLGWLGILVGILWVLNILSKIFYPTNNLSGLVLFSFLLWVFLTGLKLHRLANLAP